MPILISLTEISKPFVPKHALGQASLGKLPILSPVITHGFVVYLQEHYSGGFMLFVTLGELKSI